MSVWILRGKERENTRPATKHNNLSFPWLAMDTLGNGLSTEVEVYADCYGILDSYSLV
jgi:hypothetical protein